MKRLVRISTLAGIATATLAVGSAQATLPTPEAEILAQSKSAAVDEPETRTKVAGNSSSNSSSNRSSNSSSNSSSNRSSNSSSNSSSNRSGGRGRR